MIKKLKGVKTSLINHGHKTKLRKSLRTIRNDNNKCICFARQTKKKNKNKNERHKILLSQEELGWLHNYEDIEDD